MPLNWAMKFRPSLCSSSSRRLHCWPRALQVRRPSISERVDYEGELGVVIARKCYQLAADEDVRPYILGYTCVNDVTARDLQKKDGQFTRAKGFDTFCPVGPLVTNEIDPWAGIGVETRVNGVVRQQGNTRDFIFPLDAVIRYISQVMTLLPGDLIPTGTPQGVGPVVAGETMEVTVEGIGTLRNPVSEKMWARAPPLAPTFNHLPRFCLRPYAVCGSAATAASHRANHDLNSSLCFGSGGWRHSRRRLLPAAPQAEDR